jgi:hypothetical protein
MGAHDSIFLPGQQKLHYIPHCRDIKAIVEQSLSLQVVSFTDTTGSIRAGGLAAFV